MAPSGNAERRAAEGEGPAFTKAADAALPLFNHGVSLLCWAYNEELLIADYLRRCAALMRDAVADFEIVVIDDGSTDATPGIVRQLQAEIPQIRLYVNDRNRNVGYSSKRAIRKATKEYLFWQTIDWSYDISMLRTFLSLLESHDVVAGVRRAPRRDAYGPLGKALEFIDLVRPSYLRSRSDNSRKALVSIINYVLIRLLYRMPLSDFQNVVFYPTALVQSLRLEADSSFANPEILLKAYWRGARIVEVPIPFLPRQQGEAKGTRFAAIRASVRDVFKYWGQWVLLGRRGPVTKGTVTRLDPSAWETCNYPR